MDFAKLHAYLAPMPIILINALLAIPVAILVQGQATIYVPLALMATLSITATALPILHPPHLLPPPPQLYLCVGMY